LQYPIPDAHLSGLPIAQVNSESPVSFLQVSSRSEPSSGSSLTLKFADMPTNTTNKPTAARAAGPARTRRRSTSPPVAARRSRIDSDSDDKSSTDESDDGNNHRRTSRPPTSRRRLVKGAPCCSCTRYCTCSRANSKSGVECILAGRRCVTCACLHQCRNKHKPPTTVHPPGTLFGYLTQPCVQEADPLTPAPSPTNPVASPGANSRTAANGAPLPPRPSTSPCPPTGSAPTDTNQSEAQTASANAEAPTDATASEQATTTEPNRQQPATTPDDDGGGDTDETEPANPPAPPNLGAGNHATPPAPTGPIFGTETGADLPDYTLTEADIKLDTAVYGDHVHNNDGTHLDGGIVDDHRWQRRWRRLVAYTPNRYEAPKGRVGRRFISMLAEAFDGVTTRRWNSERPIVFAAVILITLLDSAQARR
jgi:hypothetical protein